MEINIIHVKSFDIISQLQADSALTFEGMSIDEDNLQAIFNWLWKYTPMKRHDLYVISGALMNSYCECKGNNRYPDDLNIVAIKLSDMENPTKIVLPRISVGGRWMDDIISNNQKRIS